MIVGLKVADDTEIEGDGGVLRPRSEPDLLTCASIFCDTWCPRSGGEVRFQFCDSRPAWLARVSEPDSADLDKLRAR